MTSDADNKDSTYNELEQLRALLAQTRRERDDAVKARDKAISARDAAVSEKEQALKDKEQAERDRDQAESGREQAVKERDEARAELAACILVIDTCMQDMRGLITARYGTLFNFEEFLKKSLQEKLGFIISRMVSSIKSQRTFARLLLSSGQDLPKNPRLNSSSGLEDNSRPGINTGTAVSELTGRMMSMASDGRLSPEEASELLKCAGKINKICTRLPKRQEPEKRTGGKRSVDRNRLKRCETKPQEAPKSCSQGHTSIVSIASIENEMIKAVKSLDKTLGTVNFKAGIYGCTQCGEIICIYDHDPDVTPITPYAILPISLHSWECECLHAGCSLNRITDGIRAAAGLGGHTIYRSLKRFVELYLKGLYELIIAEFPNSPVWYFDETPLDALEEMGEGPFAKRSSKRQKSSQTYLIQASSSDLSEHRIRAYAYCPSRRAEDIADVLDKLTSLGRLKFTDPERYARIADKISVCVDGYAGYSSFFERHGINCVQRCLVHARRRGVTDLDDSINLEALRRMTSEERQAYYAKLISTDDPVAVEAAILFCISRIYEVESSVSKSDPDYIAKITTARREFSRPLMDVIDGLVSIIRDGCITIGRRGGITKIKGRPGADFCCYYLQYRDELRSFLDNPYITPDQSLCERMIRPVALGKAVSFFHQTQEYTEIYCIIMTVISTALANGITNIQEYLNAVAAAGFEHCLKGAMSRYWLANGHDIDAKRPKGLPNNYDFDFDEESKSFDFTPFLPWNYQEKNPLKIKNDDDRLPKFKGFAVRR